jgi:hypothetical protein
MARWQLVLIFLISGNLKNSLCESSKMLEKMCAATCEHGTLYSETGQEIAGIQHTVTSIAEAQNRYCVYYSHL